MGDKAIHVYPRKPRSFLRAARFLTVTSAIKSGKRSVRNFSFAKSVEEGGITAFIPTDNNMAQAENIRKDLLLFAAGAIDNSAPLN